MKNKIHITEKQAYQFNEMLRSLQLIYKGYETPEKLRKQSGQKYGLDYAELLEMAYENIQNEAKQSTKGVKAIKTS